MRIIFLNTWLGEIYEKLIGFVRENSAATDIEVKVKNFSVPDVEISDHLPLILDFEI